MSHLPDEDPECRAAGDCPPVETVIIPRARDLGGFEVRRALPAASRMLVGPFIFFDQMGPAEFLTGAGIDVRPHPHIGLATVTWLVEGELMHRDSLGTAQVIRPGEVNWMTAGAGIVHSERTPGELRRRDTRMFGLQAWVALPERDEETAPEFAHFGRDELPKVEGDGAAATLIAGAAWGARSPVAARSEMVYADVALAPGAALPVPVEHVDRALYVLDGEIDIAGDVFAASRLVVLRPGVEVTVRSLGGARLLLLGGEPMEGPRYIWWNFVSSSAERIEQAKADWRAGRFAKVPRDDEATPLPDLPGKPRRSA